MLRVSGLHGYKFPMSRLRRALFLFKMDGASCDDALSKYNHGLQVKRDLWLGGAPPLRRVSIERFHAAPAMLSQGGVDCVLRPLKQLAVRFVASRLPQHLGCHLADGHRSCGLSQNLHCAASA